MRPKIILFVIISILFCHFSFAQTFISGIVTTVKGEPITGANIYIKGTYSGTTSGKDGKFSFESDLSGNQLLVVSFISYEAVELPVQLSGNIVNTVITMKESLNNIDAVFISAGMFEAGDEKKSVILNSLDIATTAGAGADITSAFQTLPGATMPGGKTGLHVRGGEGRETVMIIDGMRVTHPYYSQMPDISERGRFSPFLFQGMYFSTGGYSAEYGQGLSSALVLNSTGFPDETYTSLGLMSLGMSAGHFHRWENTALGFFGSYYNLNPNNQIVPQNTEWETAPVAAEGSLVYRQKTSETGLIKTFFQYSDNQSALYINNLDTAGLKSLFSLNNKNLYTSTTYKEQLSTKLILSAAVSFSNNTDKIKFIDNPSLTDDMMVLTSVRLKRALGELSHIKAGVEFQHSRYNIDSSYIKFNFKENYSAAFSEIDLFLSPKLLFRAGARAEYSAIFKKANISPRLSVAVKTGEQSQVSLSYGLFCQAPEIYFSYYGSLHGFEKATHYIINFQKLSDQRSFRVEAFYKQYNRIVMHEGEGLSLNGNGYAAGFDVFWRDKKTIKNIDYWFSYSFLDTKRKYLFMNKVVHTMPDFASKHSLSAVCKVFIPKINSSIGGTYLYRSGRPYENPWNNDEGKFMSNFTSDYHNVSLSINYLTSIFGSFTVIVASVDNIFGFENIHGYHFSKRPYYRKEPVKDPAKRFYFLGIFVSFGRDNSDDF
jgi:hypothetical protein